MATHIEIVHHADRRTDVVMPYAPAIRVRGGRLVFLAGVTAAPVYHSHPHRDEEFDLPASMREQAVLTMENLKKTVEAAGGTLSDLVFVTRYLTDVREQDDLNRVWAAFLGGTSAHHDHGRGDTASHSPTVQARDQCHRCGARPKGPGPVQAGGPGAGSDERRDRARLRRPWGHGRAHGQAPSRRRLHRDRLQPHRGEGPLAHRSGAAPRSHTARGGG